MAGGWRSLRFRLRLGIDLNNGLKKIQGLLKIGLKKCTYFGKTQ